MVGWSGYRRRRRACRARRRAGVPLASQRPDSGPQPGGRLRQRAHHDAGAGCRRRRAGRDRALAWASAYYAAAANPLRDAGTTTRRYFMSGQPSAKAAGTIGVGGDLTVNRLGFGAMRVTGQGIWGDPPDVQKAKAALRRAVELDVNFIDTADSY